MTSPVPFGEESLRQIAKTNIVGMCCWNIHGSIVEANDMFCRMTGYTQQEVQAGDVKLADLCAPGARPVNLPALD
ncbi:MAG TPA: PAS domain-containing protein, partial [Verrucomicrobiae bacterium]|nr:PAS domain-containing protein [Verrucomicrobiae bacterium]